MIVGDTINQTVHGTWIGDYWEHAAVIRELSRHPLHPAHPLFALNAPSQFFSPYALGLALVARLAYLGAQQALAVAAIANTLFLLLVVPSFVRVFSSEKHTAFYTLLFMLLLWGSHPWAWSGLFHLDVIGQIAPYPSTFATALAMGTVVMWARHLEAPSARRLASVTIAASVIVLTHPPVAIFLFAAMAALLAQRRRTGATRLRDPVIVTVLALSVALLWPYFPFLTLLRDHGAFDASNVSLYRDVIPALFPLALAALAFPSRLRADRRDALSVTVAGLIAVYLAGYLLSKWSLGRVLPLIILLLDVALADLVARRQRLAKRPRLLGASVVVAVAILAVVDLSPGADLAAAIPGHGKPGLGRYYASLLAHVPAGSVVMATPTTGWEIPAYGGRIVASLHPEAFVSDITERNRAVAAFFEPATSTAERRRLLHMWHARYVLVRKSSGPGFRAIIGLGAVVASAGGYTLVRAAS